MTLLLIALAAAAASALTFTSGFGLGTLLLPVFALILPVTEAVAATALVHLAHTLFKSALLLGRADLALVARFGLPAAPAALLGGWLLGRVAAPGQIVGTMLILLACLELWPRFAKLRAPAWAMPIGGALTGFVGGLTGQQGALRSVFLLRAGLSPAAFIATGAAIAVLIDVSRLLAYGLGTLSDWPLILAGAAGALVTSLVMVRHIDRMTIGFVRFGVAGLLLAVGGAMIAGLIGD